MFKKSLILILMSILFSIFCTTQCHTSEYQVEKETHSILPPTTKILQTADYGKYPENYQEIIKNYMYKVAIDPNSLMYRDWKIFKDWAWDDKNKKYVFGYSVCVYINGKNRFGGYTGWQLYYFFIRDKELYLNKNVLAFEMVSYSMPSLKKICDSIINDILDELCSKRNASPEDKTIIKYED